MDSIVTNEMNVWIAGGISPWEMNRFTSELDRQIDKRYSKYRNASTGCLKMIFGC